MVVLWATMDPTEGSAKATVFGVCSGVRLVQSRKKHLDARESRVKESCTVGEVAHEPATKAGTRLEGPVVEAAAGSAAAAAAATGAAATDAAMATTDAATAAVAATSAAATVAAAATCPATTAAAATAAAVGVTTSTWHASTGG
ncbi:unnamed protein product [Closterium sp. NIES-53]